ncbi:ABC-type transport auxiliary lipoprotein family protein [Rhodospirillum centenum]|uniref:Lipoprotein, putative n=1 Tax=Rhodospirillum centenum (strain ATCC 51521 / SW) TaxID=414684 RepID=B6IT86_RHOCS|nr:ABC-type transport auxiliary lipoprotein family protein [Rhodospirillum centenum]ACI98844.1 lipoprotein, putative [Rhodospirillum centenum SW]
MTFDPNRRRLLGLTATLPLLGGCSVADVLTPPPPRLYVLSPAREFTAGLPRVDWQLLVETPLANTGIDTARIALGETQSRLTYFAGANWVDRAPSMAQLLLIESFENSNRIVAVGREATGLRADFILKTDLRDFQAEYNGGTPGESRPVGRVRMTAKLVRMPRRIIVASESFEAQVPAKGSAFSDMIEAMDDALEAVMRRMVEWTIRQGHANVEADPIPAAFDR